MSKLNTPINTLVKRLRARLAQDAGEKWITVNGGSKSGGEGGGSHVMIDSEGRVIAGMGGKFTGIKIDDIPRENFINEGAYRMRSTAASTVSNRTAPAPAVATAPAVPTGATSAPAPAVPTGANKVHKDSGRAGLDYSAPDKVPEHLIIQNRDRGNVASRHQIEAIAKNPDYDRMSISRTMADGAPIVAYGKIPDQNYGRVIKVTDATGKKIMVQYAVMSADDVTPSHNADGRENKKFYSTDPNVTRAIAGNGRIAGIQSAYSNGTADTYRNDLMADPDHGVDPAVIAGIKNPVLVRVMQPKDVTADIGDRSNTTANLTLNAVERAKNDIKRVQINNIKTYEDGTPTKESITEFVSKMPESERGSLIDTDGTPTREAAARMDAAIIAVAYPNDRIIRLSTQAMEPEHRRIIQGIRTAAPDVANLAGSADPEYRLNTAFANATERAILGKNRRESPAEVYGQQSLFPSKSDALEREIAGMIMSSNSSQKITEGLRAAARALKEEGDKESDDLFGAVVKRPPEKVIQDWRRANNWEIYPGEFAPKSGSLF